MKCVYCCFHPLFRRLMFLLRCVRVLQLTLALGAVCSPPKFGPCLTSCMKRESFLYVSMNKEGVHRRRVIC
jgi:hypothetical protein